MLPCKASHFWSLLQIPCVVQSCVLNNLDQLRVLCYTLPDCGVDERERERLGASSCAMRSTSSKSVDKLESRLKSCGAMRSTVTSSKAVGQLPCQPIPPKFGGWHFHPPNLGGEITPQFHPPFLFWWMKCLESKNGGHKNMQSKYERGFHQQF